MTANTTPEGRTIINTWFKAVTEPEGGTPKKPNQLLVVIGPTGSGKRTLTRAIKEAAEASSGDICSVFTDTEETPVDYDALVIRAITQPTILVLEDESGLAKVQDAGKVSGVIVHMPAIAEPGIHERISRLLRGQLLNGAGL